VVVRFRLRTCAASFLQYRTRLRSRYAIDPPPSTDQPSRKRLMQRRFAARAVGGRLELQPDGRRRIEAVAELR